MDLFILSLRTCIFFIKGILISMSHSLAMFEFSVLIVVGLLTSRGEILS